MDFKQIKLVENKMKANENKLIAEFMQSLEDGLYLDGLYFYKGGYYDELEFNSSWEWLMPVLKRINLKLTPQNYSEWRMISRPTEYDISSVHNQTVEFIKFYNKNK